MRKIITTIVSAIALMLFLLINVSAATNVTIIGNNTLRAGDTLVVGFNVSNNPGLFGIQGNIIYNSSDLEYVEGSEKFNDNGAGSGASILYNPSTGIFMVDSQNTFTSGGRFTIEFKVKSGLTVGTSVKVQFANIALTSWNDTQTGLIEETTSVTYTKSLAAPISTDATLLSLKITNASGGANITLNPTFSKNNTSYTASVPFDVSKINVSAEPTDSKSTVAYTRSYTLPENSTTTISVKVTAESGATKTYTVKVTRPKDPNYVPSSNANLSSLAITGQTLSPAFSSSVTAYTVDVPFQVSSVKVTAKAQDSKATVKVTGAASSLVAGQENKITVTCTAENGTKKVYTIIVKRAADTGETTPPVIDTEVPPIDIPTTDTVITDDLTGVTCVIPQDKAPADATFTVQEIVSGDVYDAYSAVVPEGETLKVYNTLMFASGYEIQPSGSVKITFPAIDGMDSEKARIYTYENGELVEVPFTSVDGTYVWETHRLGTVAILSSAVEDVADDTTVTPETQDEETDAETQSGDTEEKSGLGIGIVIAIAAAALVLGAGGAFAVMTIKSKKG